jgi:hypothetical protein
MNSNMTTQSQPAQENGGGNYRKAFKPNFGDENNVGRGDSRPSVNSGFSGNSRPPMNNSRIDARKTNSHYAAMKGANNDPKEYEPTVRSGAVRSSRVIEPESYKQPSYGESSEIGSNIPRASKPRTKPLGGAYNRQPKPAPKAAYKPISQPSKFEETKAKAKTGSSSYPTDFGEDAYAIPQNLKECPSCSRKFNPDALAKHKKICQKVFQTKAKKFNMQSQRVIDSDHQQILKEQKREERKFKGLKNSKLKRSAAMPGTKKGKWLNKSENFRNAMRAARGAAPIGGASYGGGGASGGYEEPDDDMVKCPT